MEIQNVANFLRMEAEEVGKCINAGHPEDAKARVIETAQKILAAFPPEPAPAEETTGEHVE